ncbi:MAG: hypothetical protein IAE64_06595 [Flavobacteriales bacterium]|nr:MAG: hypothetical protein F9K28_09855 [Bacteroidota bacterium]KXK36225.1 MAG: hypothetical protein UZ06_CHB003000028 [Chlorobi bacterium OLB6]MBE2265899.1 hypothetical protein [Flavobacteriales bacterium]MBV6464681.1 hypothetical protein [Chlorobiota bacterium]MBW7854467.1 hypothetical protein [Candidatus Kapabacteria bacterium]MCC6331972.1 hypothetical protein [Ignavibacteria bacterium]
MFKCMLLGGIMLGCSVLAGASTHEGENEPVAMNIPSGIDTLPPVLSYEYLGCGVYEFTAVDDRNSPNPPRVPPLPMDQVERGIASVSLQGTLSSVNTKLTLVTDQYFPRETPYHRFVFRIEPADKSKPAWAYVYVTDYSGNQAVQLLTMGPTMPLWQPQSVESTARVGKSSASLVTLKNSSSEVQTVTNIAVTGSAVFTVASGGLPLPTTIAPGQTRTVEIAFSPTDPSSTPERAVLSVTTDCGSFTVPLSGQSLYADLQTEDWDAGTVLQQQRICKDGGFSIENRGSAPATITGFTSSDPDVAITSSISASNPYVLPPSDSVLVTDLCYQGNQVGPFTATVTVLSDAEAGDFICQVVANSVISEVASEPVTKQWAWYNPSTESIMLRENQEAYIVDIHGTVVGEFPEDSSRFSAAGLASGVYLVAFRNGTPAVTVRIVR